MKKVLFLLLWCTATLPVPAQQTYSNLRFEPALPKPGEKIEVTYDPKGTPLADAKAVEANAFLYDGTKYKVQDLTLAREGELFKGTLRTEAATDGVAFSFYAEDTQDHNQKKGYATFLYDSKGQPVPGAQGGLALMYISWGGYSLGLDRNPKTAASLLEKELTTYPSGEATFLSTALTVLATGEKEKAQEAVLRKLDEVAQKKNLTHEELAVLASWYGRYKQKEKAKKYEALALQKNPKGEFAEQHRFIKIYEEQDSDRKLALFNQFVKDFPKSNNTAQLYGILTNYYFTREDSAGLQRFIEQYGKHIPDGTYNSLAQKLYEGGKNLPLAESLAVQAVAQAREALGRQSEEKPDSYSDKMWKTMREYALGKALGTYGTILDKRGKPEAAYNSLKEAAAIQKGKDTETNELYVALLTKTNRQKEAMVAGEQFIGEGKGTVKMKEDLRQAYIAVNGNEKGYDRYLASLEAPAREKMKSELARKMISEPAPAFSLQDLNGNPVSLAELKGKTIVVDFWATWCGPCVASMPAMQQAMNKYKDNPDVKFLFINSWQNEPDKQKVVSEFLRKKKFDFTVPLDAENKVITAYKVDGIPTKFVIDPQGNIRFKSVGFSGGPDGLVEELSMMINMAAGKEL